MPQAKRHTLLYAQKESFDTKIRLLKVPKLYFAFIIKVKGGQSPAIMSHKSLLHSFRATVGLALIKQCHHFILCLCHHTAALVDNRDSPHHSKYSNRDN